MRNRILPCLLGSAILAVSLATPGCGGNNIEQGVPAGVENQPIPEIPGANDMNKQIQKKGR